MFLFKKHKKITKKGFTLIEMMVAVFVFSAVMVIAVGAIFSIVSANKTSQALKSVLDNLNSAMDSMSRNIRYGTKYCDAGLSTPCGTPNSLGALDTFTFKPHDLIVNSRSYRFNSLNKSIESSDNGGTWQPLTATEVKITNMSFYVTGNLDADYMHQPRVLITISGYAQVGTNTSNFNLETMVTQRAMVCGKYHNIDSTVYPAC